MPSKNGTHHHCPVDDNCRRKPPNGPCPVHQKWYPKLGHKGQYCLIDEKIGCESCKAECYAEQRRLRREEQEERERKKREKDEKRQADRDRQSRCTGKK